MLDKLLETKLEGAQLVGSAVARISASAALSVLVEELTPSVVLQALVTEHRRVADGVIVTALMPAWMEILRLLKEGPDVFFQLTPRQFEELVAASYERAGFDEVVLTPRSGDFGRDVIAVRNGYYSLRIIDQAKHYKPGHLVTANDVRAMSGVLLTDHQATKAFVTTTSEFASRIAEDPFIAPHLPYRLQLVNGTQLRAHLLSLLQDGDSPPLSAK